MTRIAFSMVIRMAGGPHVGREGLQESTRPLAMVRGAPEEAGRALE